MRREWKLIAMYMVFLVATIPIISASAYGSTVSITTYHGEDNVEEYLSEEDSLYVEAEITWDEETIINDTTNETEAIDFSEDYVELIFDNEEFEFDNCTNGTTITCTFEDETVSREGAALELEVKLYDADAELVSEDSGTVYVDAIAPEIEEFDMPETIIDDFNVSYEVSDQACDTCIEACAGLYSIEFTINDEVRESVSFTTAAENTTDTTESVCSTSGIFETNTDDLDNGEVEACLIAVDRVGHETTSCLTILVDYSGPEFDAESFVLVDEDGYDVTHFNDAMDVTMSINLSEDSGLDTSTVYANLSAFNEEMADDYGALLGSCTEMSEGNYYCYWSFIIDLTNESSVLVAKFSATDNAGNEGSYSKSVDLEYDVDAPVVQSITSIWGEYMNQYNNTLYMEINEEGAGFDKNNVYLNLGEIGLGNVKADYCEASGSIWTCYWEEFTASSTVAEGYTILVYPYNIVDDIGNSYDEESSVSSQDFTFDKTEPEFLNVTISPVGTGLEILTEGDIAQITALIYDETAGVDEETVFADFSEFDSAEGWEAAQSCEDFGTGEHECIWEYTGQLHAGSVRMELFAVDFAGNVKYSGDDNEYGDADIVEFEEKEVDYWEEEIDAGTLPDMNPNFLRQSQQGTIVYLDFTLRAKSLEPYVHMMEITSCTGIPHVKPVQDVEQEFGIVSQLYYPEDDTNTRKYLLLNVPALLAELPYDEEIETEGSYIEITCNGYVVQSRTRLGDIYTPDEEFNVTAILPLKPGLFTQPDLATIDKIQRFEKFIDFLDKYLLSWMKFLAEWGPKICGPIAAIRSLVNNLLTTLKAVRVAVWAFGGKEILSGAVGENGVLDRLSEGIDKLWKGRKGKGNMHCDPEGGGNPAWCLNPNAMVSIGYICDLVLCEYCGKIWRENILGSIAGAIRGDNVKEPLVESVFNLWFDKVVKVSDTAYSDYESYVGGEFQYGVASERVVSQLDPRQNLVVALVCSPPCITGIYTRLNVYRSILIAYNACLNVAAIKDEDISQCDEFLTAQICQQLVNAFFWHWFDDLLRSFLAKAAVVTLENVIKGLLFKCPQLKVGEALQEVPVSCSTFRGIEAIANFVFVSIDTVQTLESLGISFKGMGADKDARELQEEAEAEIEEEYEKDWEEELEGQVGGAEVYD